MRSPPAKWSHCCCATASRSLSATEPLSRSAYHLSRQAPSSIPAAQAYRPFLLVMLRPQHYPEVRPSVDGPIIKPYDVASWSLPLTMGVDVVESVDLSTGAFETIAAADWPRPAVTVDDRRRPLIPAGADALYTTVNRLLADGSEVSTGCRGERRLRLGDV